MVTSIRSWSDSHSEMLEKSTAFWFSNDLQVFLPSLKKGKPICIKFKGAQTAKHLIESIGIPHTEIAFLAANHLKIDLDYLVEDHSFIEVFSFIDLPHDPLQQQNNLSNLDRMFILDNHLGRLTAYLRMLGFDCLYDPGLPDSELAEISNNTHRTILTRDRRLLMRKIILSGYFLRSKQPLQQVVEIIHRFNLQEKIRPFLRCMRCNHLLLPIEKEKILHRLQPKTRHYYQEFRLCSNCDQIYWQGSHYDYMQKTIEMILNESE
jgi:uncharacterized protein